jgi:hypothetical protein
VLSLELDNNLAKALACAFSISLLEVFFNIFAQASLSSLADANAWPKALNALPDTDLLLVIGMKPCLEVC